MNMKRRFNSILVGLVCSLSWGISLSQTDSSPVVTHIFTDWTKVDPGNAIFPVDLTYVDEHDQQLIAKVRDYYKATMHISEGPTASRRIRAASGVKIGIEKGRLVGPWLKPEKPWERSGIGPKTVLHEDGRYRLWYGCGWTVRDRAVVAPDGRLKLGSDGGGSGVCYAESEDGLNWKRVSMGMLEFEGSRDNNLIAFNALAGINGHIFIDPNAPPEERYKTTSLTNIRLFRPDAKSMGGILGAAVSPDGIHWKRLPEPLWDTYFNNDGVPSIYFDGKLKKYVMLMRQNYPRRRSIARAETSDFRRWPHPTLVLTPGPEESPSDDFYNNTYLHYPGTENTHLMVASVYHRDTSLVDLRMATSLDGIVWNWISRESIVELGEPGGWAGGSMYAVSSMVQLPDGRIAVPIVGSSWSHNEWWKVRFQKDREWPRGIGWATWEDGRLAGIEAAQEGRFTTQRFRFQGKPVEVNLRTHGDSGSVAVELMVEGDPNRKVYPAQPISGNHLWVPLAWKDGEGVGNLAGKTVRLRFRLFNAKIFGFRSEGMVAVDPLRRPKSE